MTLAAFSVDQGDQENQEVHNLTYEEIPDFRFRILLDEESWLNVFLPEGYPETNPECYFSSNKINRHMRTLINREIEGHLQERRIGGRHLFFAIRILSYHVKSGDKGANDPKNAVSLTFIKM